MEEEVPVPVEEVEPALRALRTEFRACLPRGRHWAFQLWGAYKTPLTMLLGEEGYKEAGVRFRSAHPTSMMEAVGLMHEVAISSEEELAESVEALREALRQL